MKTTLFYLFVIGMITVNAQSVKRITADDKTEISVMPVDNKGVIQQYNVPNPDEKPYLDIDKVKKKDVRIYPNPTSGVIRIYTENNISIKIFDLNGKIIKETKDKSIDLSGYASGVYILYINGEIEKVIKR